MTFNILAIDYGDSKIGTAVALEGAMAIASDILKNDQDLFLKLKEIIQEKEIEKIVVGLPLNLKGEKTEQTKKVENFIADLKKQINLLVVVQDERYSTLQIKKLGVKQDDALAAQLILESYLESLVGFRKNPKA